jgi:hypothetical protein
MGTLEVLQGRVHGPKLGPHPSQGRESRRLRFDNSSDLIEVAEQAKVGSGALLPVEDVGIESVPLLSGTNVGAVVRTRRNQPLFGEDLDRLPDSGAAGAVPVLNLRDVHDIAGTEIAPPDSAAKALDDLSVQPHPLSPS